MTKDTIQEHVRDNDVSKSELSFFLLCRLYEGMDHINETCMYVHDSQST
jgi:hypothetical protein